MKAYIKQKKTRGILHMLWILLITISLTACSNAVDTSRVNTNISTYEKDKSNGNSTNSDISNKAIIDKNSSSVTEDIKIHFIDVGQGDSVLIQQDNLGILIDAGDNGSGEEVVSYIKNQGIDKLSYVIGTHPHEDHIGGLDFVINHMIVENVILPKFTLDTKTYKDVLYAIDDNNLKITLPTLGESFTFGNSIFTIIAPVKSDYGDNANNYSVGIKFDYDGISFVSIGDAEIEAEKDILGMNVPLEADLFKVSHHGSDTSNSEKFIQAIDPIYGVISVGEGNSYGHPYYSVLSLLEDEDVQLYRTDHNGTIIATIHNGDITFKTLGSEKKLHNNNEPIIEKDKNDSNNNQIVYKTKTGSKYHKDGCVHLSKSKIELTLSEALDLKYEPCNVCYPD